MIASNQKSVPFRLRFCSRSLLRLAHQFLKLRQLILHLRHIRRIRRKLQVIGQLGRRTRVIASRALFSAAS